MPRVQDSLADLGGLLTDGIRQCAATVIGKQCQYRIVDPVIVDDLAGKCRAEFPCDRQLAAARETEH